MRPNSVVVLILCLELMAQSGLGIMIYRDENTEIQFSTLFTSTGEHGQQKPSKRSKTVIIRVKEGKRNRHHRQRLDP